MQDAILTSSPRQIRALFAIVLVACFPSNPKALWEKFKHEMSEDIPHRARQTTNYATLDLFF
ncbi:hypothetical protein BC826DRAFT_928486 [Russula brevipes]|nr:hypothetical protein BC826DRAFT_928486 [Russula brevipes]